MKLLEDIVVVDFSQFLSGPSAGLTLADMGANVIKIEKPETGDICRHLYVSDVILDEDSSIFHAINRNKKSYMADLKNRFDIKKIYKLIEKADIVIHNFRPGVMERLGFSYHILKSINPSLIYGSISGYGEGEVWKHLPGQDLLLQSVTGATALTGNKEDQPTPMGVAIIDMLAGAHLAQGILAMLYQRSMTEEGGTVQVSMFESALDLQFEGLTCFLNDGHELPRRSAINGAHPYVGAPYGIYKTADDYIAIAMADIVHLGKVMNCSALQRFTDNSEWYFRRDEIKQELAMALLHKTTREWLEILEPAGFWCSGVLNYQQLRKEESYQELEMEMVVKNSNGIEVTTTRSPYRVDGELLLSNIGAPLLGEHNKEIDEQFDLNAEK
ncbi:MAG TPA: CoA transferase [Niabella sp.]|nr:CoA transferase [Niabella sp.]HOZ98170.1 CoA transferase [Niabella sp.]HQW16066.1 CoA transferase [Niabella sp.]HQX21278.1 CoA transferase [Niabella sp.]HQX41965.1 CoA transferase [Niabella sp.]